ncbi:hypothetical protein X743_14475 [Mesorhizobium sp. LNHC252B00]|nr:hypothetical protein X743_14475 [Mesorhizobium sp. LNHC252B00]
MSFRALLHRALEVDFMDVALSYVALFYLGWIASAGPT